MTTYNRGDVVLVPFPFTDLTIFKKRPCVVISSNNFNKHSEDIIVAAITSNPAPRKISWEYYLNDKEQKSCGLPIPSLIKLGKIVTLDKSIVIKKLGEVPIGSMEKILSKLPIR